MKEVKSYRNIAVLFLISPFFSFLLMTVNFKQRSSYHGLLFFSLFLGFFFVLEEGNDGYRHAANVSNHYENLTFPEFISESVSILTFNPAIGTNDDMFLHSVSYVSSTLPYSGNFLFLFVSLLYTFLYLSSIRLLLSLNQYDLTVTAVLFLLLFVLSKSFEGMNSVRTWNGAWVCFFGTISFCKTRKVRYLFLLSSSVLFHFSFFVFIIPIIFSLVIGNRNWLFLIALALSFVFRYGNPYTDMMKSYAALAPLAEKKFDTYAKIEDKQLEKFDAKMQHKISRSNFYVAYYNLIIQSHSLLILIVLIFITGYYLPYHGQQIFRSMLSIAICFLAFINFIAFIPAVLSRGSIIFSFFVYGAAFLIFNSKKLTYRYSTIIKNIVFSITAPVFVLVLINKISAFLAYVDFLLLLPPFLYVFIESPGDIKSVVKLLFLK